MNGSVEEVTRRLEHSTIRNGQTVPKLKPDFFHVPPFYIAIYGNVHNITLEHNGLLASGLLNQTHTHIRTHIHTQNACAHTHTRVEWYMEVLSAGSPLPPPVIVQQSH